MICILFREPFKVPDICDNNLRIYRKKTNANFLFCAWMNDRSRIQYFPYYDDIAYLSRSSDQKKNTRS